MGICNLQTIVSLLWRFFNELGKSPNYLEYIRFGNNSWIIYWILIFLGRFWMTLSFFLKKEPTSFNKDTINRI